MGRIEDLRIKYGLNRVSMETIKNTDPTANKKYVPWLLSVRYVKRSSDGKYVVDKTFPTSKIPLVRELLLWFDNNLNGKIPLEYRDIHTFKSVDHFISTISEIKKPSISEIKKQIRLVLDDEDFKILVPLTFESSKIYGSNTKWCTTQEKHYNNYTEKGILYYIMDKRTGNKFGCPVGLGTFRSTTFYNAEDEQIMWSVMKKVYGEKFFNKIKDAMKLDHEAECFKIKKRKIKESVIKKLSQIKHDLTTIHIHLDGLDELEEKVVNRFSEID